jgi:hypothetical protein
VRSSSFGRGAWLIGGAAATLALSGCGHSSAQGGSTTARAHVSAAPTAPPFTSTDANRLSRNLTAGSPVSVRSAIAMPAGQALSPSAAAQLSALGTVTFDESTFRVIDARDATVVGRVQHPPAGQTATWTFVLSYVDGTWKISDAEPRQ